MNTPFVPAGRTTVSHLVDSPIGPLALTSDGTALTGVYMLDPGQPGPDLPRDPAPFQAVTAELAAYFAGELETFTVPLAPTGSAFQLAVWAELTRIPYGATSTYGGIAKALGKRPVASRAVGSANGANPIPIIVPCHRVIGADGGLTGYGGGLPRKLALLKIEGAAGLWLSVAGICSRRELWSSRLERDRGADASNPHEPEIRGDPRGGSGGVRRMRRAGCFRRRQCRASVSVSGRI